MIAEAVITDAVLARAVENGVVSAEQAEALTRFAHGSTAHGSTSPSVPEPVDDEALRFVSGFADIFVTIGIVLFVGSAAYLIGRRLPESATSAIVAALAWLLAEFFTRRRRMALPSIALLVIFALSSFLALAGSFGRTGSGIPRGMLGWLGSLLDPGQDPVPLALAGLGTAGLAALHYWRFRVPITVASGVSAMALTVLALVYAAAPETTAWALNPILFGLGTCIFALAMRFDLADPARLTRRTDIAFWLHLLASPLIVHSVFREIGAGSGFVTAQLAIGTIAVFLALALVAVVVDRRAMLVSGLIYAGIAFGSLIRRAGITDLGLPVTLCVLGAFVLLLSAGWTPLRRALLVSLPGRIASRLPAPLAR